MILLLCCDSLCCLCGVFASALAWNPITTGSVPITWPSGNPETTWQISSTYTSNDLPASSVQSALTNAMNEWSEPGCSDFNAVRGSNTSANPMNTNDNTNTVGFVESGWPASYGQTTLAITTPMFYSNGNIVNADMVINESILIGLLGHQTRGLEADLESVAAHEFGHWIGFDHSNFQGSVKCILFRWDL